MSARGVTSVHVTEVGGWHPKGSNIFSYIQDGVRTTLVEPDPESMRLIKDAFGEMGNVTRHEVAACDINGETDLCKRGSSTFVTSLPTGPARVNDACIVAESEKFTVMGRRFDDIDDGSMDLISVDTEGSEWFVIKHLKSARA